MEKHATISEADMIIILSLRGQPSQFCLEARRNRLPLCTVDTKGAHVAPNPPFRTSDTYSKCSP
ncbi:hypothetical protein M407DRAFT_246086, partial [Tulasnella calospora MUT 4182]